MNRVILIGMTAIAATIAAPAIAGPEDADLWVGISNGSDGVLINEATGEAWLTGVCLKQLSPAAKTGDIWRSRTVEQVSVGRSMVTLDQTFTLDLDPSGPSLTVDSVDRGMSQRFPATVVTQCQATATCRALLSAPNC